MKQALSVSVPRSDHPWIHRVIRRFARPVLVAGTVLFGGVALAQDASLEVTATSSASAFGRTVAPGTESLARAGGVSSHASTDGQLGGLTGGAWASAWGVVDYGHMQLQTVGGAHLSGAGTIDQVVSSAEAHARLTDSFLITCPTCVAGTEATVTFRLVAEGGVFADGNLVQNPDLGSGTQFTAFSAISSGFYMSAPDVNNPGSAVQDAMFRSLLRMQYGGDSHDRPIWDGEHTASFIIGQPLSFTWDAVVQGSATVGNFNLDAAMDGVSAFNTSFGSSLYWGGITEVRDVNGQLLSGITAFNAVGVDYANALAPAVPEPTTGLLMTVGALMLLAAIRRQRRR
ncbi:PEP-CTERM protein-sorting domain-containing protein [Roseateles sp. YR242]|uniref:PEP-CTERM sorting domain-containing protein n=1 Tax=Roseateles sp. YR242 TaxID=1855305 RepID=UPI0008AFAADE|nr:PEP-CTERM sorting domain-containing protein [Roseateles sp. YR242]SEL89208.1 PEP-CTERM protein-sorting domain-containing protein [Roseateles sp. YR242]